MLFVGFQPLVQASIIRRRNVERELKGANFLSVQGRLPMGCMTPFLGPNYWLGSNKDITCYDVYHFWQCNNSLCFVSQCQTCYCSQNLNFSRTKGPRTLHMKIQKMQSSSIHIFSTAFYMSNDFLTDFLRKIFVVSCVVCKGLNSLITTMCVF